MSVTFHLFNPRDDIDYTGSVFDKVKYSDDNRTDLDNAFTALGINDQTDGAKRSEIIDQNSFSDNMPHEIIDLTYIKAMLKGNRDCNRILNKLNGQKVKTYTNVYGYTYRYVVADEVLYRQGWFLKKKWFKKKSTTAICTTEKQLKDFFDRYIDRKQDRGRECEKVFLEAFKPGMIFECAF